MFDPQGDPSDRPGVPAQHRQQRHAGWQQMEDQHRADMRRVSACWLRTRLSSSGRLRRRGTRAVGVDTDPAALGYRLGRYPPPGVCVPGVCRLQRRFLCALHDLRQILACLGRAAEDQAAS
jgi:hypothetical protein